MNIYIMLIKDRHVDVTAVPFLDCGTAIKTARDTATKLCKDARRYKEEDVPGWEFFAVYSCEGDCVWVTEHEVV